ncbi:MAG: hydrogenase formation protein HypD [Desulfobacteraceae bacterium]|nr:hydrogenase formation protein HypD [Desulfobacteraceae bacterium]
MTRYVSEFRDPAIARRLCAEIKSLVTAPWVIMEVCGGQTHAIVRSGIDQALPPQVRLVHGPGCPVCVTPVEIIDQAIAIARRPEAILCSFGDMLRVPGSRQDLLAARAQGGELKIVYSPLEALQIARENPGRQVVFLAIGFETTAPGNAMAVSLAAREGLDNFSLLVCHVLVPPAMRALLGAPDNRVQGYLAAGHVCTVTGLADYEAISRDYRVPIVVTGLEPNDILEGLVMVLRQLEAGEHRVENQYQRSVRPAGNPLAWGMVEKVFAVRDQKWRGIGLLPASGLGLREEFAAFDAARKFEVAAITPEESPLCISGLVLRGIKRPDECPAFGAACRPEQPLGATMVSSEGACAAYFHYQRL